MTKNPFLNALAALSYIALVVSLIFFGVIEDPDDSTILGPIALLSLLTLSVAVMGYLFFFQPIRMYLEGEKAAAVKFFLHTLLIFAGITAALLLILSLL